jgi:hypothetical protein
VDRGLSASRRDGAIPGDQSVGKVADALWLGCARGLRAAYRIPRLKKGDVAMNGMGRMRYLLAAGLMVGFVAPAVAESPPTPTKAEPSPVPVVPPTITDDGITASVTARLQELILLRNAQVTISTKNRVVTLVGMVPNDFAHQQALQVARSTVGVVMIDDQLRLPVWSPQAPTRN